LLTIFVALFSVAVLLPAVSAIQRRLGWSRRLASSVLVFLLVVVGLVVVLVLVGAATSAVRDFSHALPGLVAKARHSQFGSFINSGSNSLDAVSKHTSEITKASARSRAASRTSACPRSASSPSSSPSSS